MAALDLRDVEESGSVADHRPAGEIDLRDRLEATLVERPRAVGDAPAALESRPDRRMRLEPLKLLERVQERIFVVEPDHETDRHLAVFQMIEERAAVGVAGERPTDGVQDQ